MVEFEAGSQGIERVTSRREFVKRVGLGSLVGLVGLISTQKNAAATEPIAQAMWTHGTSAHIEDPKSTKQVKQLGWGTEIYACCSFNWIHFAIPTPVFVSDRRLRIRNVMLRFATLTVPGYKWASVEAVHVWDGNSRIARYDNLGLSGDHPFESFEVPVHPSVQWGIGVSVQVLFSSVLAGDTAYPWVRFVAAGGDFID